MKTKLDIMQMEKSVSLWFKEDKTYEKISLFYKIYYINIISNCICIYMERTV